MEKFGIFELLDTLSALTAERNGSPRPTDAVSLPPEYPVPKERDRGPANSEALASFLARHDAVAKKAEKK